MFTYQPRWVKCTTALCSLSISTTDTQPPLSQSLMSHKLRGLLQSSGSWSNGQSSDDEWIMIGCGCNQSCLAQTHFVLVESGYTLCWKSYIFIYIGVKVNFVGNHTYIYIGVKVNAKTRLLLIVRMLTAIFWCLVVK